MKHFALSAAAFIGVHVAAAYVAWLSGFDFDKREPMVAFYGLAALYFGCIASFAVWDLTGENK